MIQYLLDCKIDNLATCEVYIELFERSGTKIVLPKSHRQTYYTDYYIQIQALYKLSTGESICASKCVN